MKDKNSAALLSYINATISSSSEEGVERLLKMMSPSNREEMGEIYEDVLGYNPITYFDREDIRSMLKICEEKAPELISIAIKQQEDYIIEETLSRFNDDRSNRLGDDLAIVIRNLTGWSPTEVFSHDVYDYSTDGFEEIPEEESFDEEVYSDDDDEYSDVDYDED